MNDIITRKTTYDEIKELVGEHIASMAYPLDSYLEDILLTGDIYCFAAENQHIGYYAVGEETLQFFYVCKRFFRHAPSLLESAITEHSLKKVRVISQDSLLCALMVEWDYTSERGACWFTDSGAEVVNTSFSAKAVPLIFSK